jgi:NADH-quinone oxidoreductase subunit A
VKVYFDYFNIAAFVVLGILFVVANMVILALVRPKKPSAEKLATYECGEVAHGSSWVRFDMRFYTIALIFLLFDLEIAFLVPWAYVYKKMGMIAFVEGGVFVGILFLGLVYVWAKGDLDWVKSLAGQEGEKGGFPSSAEADFSDEPAQKEDEA